MTAQTKGRIRHVALSVEDPWETAEFYKQAVGLQEVMELDGPLAEGVFLTDGVVNLAILHFKSDEASQGTGVDYVGIHHIGFQVDDVVAKEAELKAAGVKPVPITHREMSEQIAGGPPSDSVNLKYLGPDDVQFDVRQRGWDESIGLAMQRYELTPAADE